MGRLNRRTLAYGFLAGVVLAAIRAPLGLDWTQLQVVDAGTAALFRAGALLAVTLFLDPRRVAFERGVAAGPLLAAALLGFAADTFLLAPLWQPASRLGFAAVLVLGALMLHRIAGPPGEHADQVERLPFVERLGLTVAAAGATIALETLAHHVRLLTLGLPEDDAMVGATFLLTLTIGAFAFGGLVARAGWQRAAPAVLAALVGPVTLLGLVFLARLGPGGLSPFLARFGLQLSDVGTWRVTLPVAAGGLVAAGFAAGTALAAARDAARFAALVLGAGVGLVLRPAVVGSLSRAVPTEELAQSAWAWAAVVLGTALAAVGALFVTLREPGRRRWVASGLVVALLVAPWVGPRVVIWSFSPWATSTIVPELCIPTSAGVVTVERAPDGNRIATIDRRRLTPTADEERVDRMRIDYAAGLLDAARREAGFTTLVIGQLTPRRALALRELGAIRVDRTAPWFAAIEPVERALFGTVRRPEGELVRPALARKRLRAGDYDLVLATPVHGPVLKLKSQAELPWGTVAAPFPGGLDVPYGTPDGTSDGTPGGTPGGTPDGTIGVAWLDAASPLGTARIEGPVLLAMDRFRHPSVGLVRGRPGAVEGAPRTLELGPPVPGPGPWELLGTLPRHRHFALHRALFDRLEQAAAGGPQAELTRGLALHFAAQRPSSPYESEVERIELDEDELRAFFADAGAVDALDPFARDLWEGLAWLLSGKRRPDLVLVYLEAVSQRHGPWPALDRVVARAYRELLDPEEALRVARRALAATPRDPDALLLVGELHLELGDPEEALGPLKEARLAVPDSLAVLVALGRALGATGDPEGRALLEALATEHPGAPGVEEALEALQVGPATDSGGD